MIACLRKISGLNKQEAVNFAQGEGVRQNKIRNPKFEIRNQARFRISNFGFRISDLTLPLLPYPVSIIIKTLSCFFTKISCIHLILL